MYTIDQSVLLEITNTQTTKHLIMFSSTSLAHFV